VFVVTDAETHGGVDVTGVARVVLAESGYSRVVLNPERCTILTQSSVMIPPTNGDEVLDPDAAPSHEQTTVFGYACSDTPERMPLPIRAAHRIAIRLDELALNGRVPGLGPDGNVQVTIEYEDERPSRVDALIIQVQHQGSPTDLQDAVRTMVVDEALESFKVGHDQHTRVVLNAEGPWLIGGPARSAGHTGRKQASDTYGGAARHGDGAVSGKDPGRMDRCAAYAARHVANNVVAAGLADECEVMLSYAMGYADPTTVFARTFGRGKLSDERLSGIIRDIFDLRPAVIARRFNLWMLPSERGGRFYRRLAEHGQVGRTDIALPWEQLDAVAQLSERAGVSPVG